MLRLIAEAFLFALGALKGSPLRTSLSLLGVTVGIFAIVGVFTAVDSLERSIRQSMSFIGEGVIYVQKWPWSFTSNYPWWRYLKRPVVKKREFDFIEAHLKEAKAAALMVERQGVIFKRESYALSGGTLRGCTYGYNAVTEVPLASGRYFAEQEIRSSRPVAIIGQGIAETLFPGVKALGNTLTYKGLKVTIIGIMKKQGKSLIGLPTNDNNMLIPYGSFARVAKIGPFASEPSIVVKAQPNDPGAQRLEAELRQLMRSQRSLKPWEEEDFAINRPEAIQGVVTAIFSVVGFAGGLIGSFSILVGAFGIANIMFVSVRERTHIIGIQKSLGAKNYFILWQFIFEAVLLALFGGVLGLLLVFALTLIPQDVLAFEMDGNNIRTGLLISLSVGLVAGAAPAWAAARLNPVDAIRSK